jgi:predicted dehydrogenase
MRESAMRLIVVGCGSIGRRHARNASSLGAEIVLCDTNLSRMTELAEELGAVAIYQDFSEAAEKSKAAAAVIATPTNFHFQPAKIMLEAGIHVLIYVDDFLLALRSKEEAYRARILIEAAFTSSGITRGDR